MNKGPKNLERIIKIASVLQWNQFRYPQPVKGRYDVATNQKEKMKWAYRCWINQLEVAEKGSGLEKFFAGQKLDFALPKGFEPETTMTMSAGGDLMAVDCLREEFTPHLFDDIAEFYFGADLTCSNLESTVYNEAPFGRNQVTGSPAKMNTSEAMLDRFLAGGMGIDYFSTANNHCYDYGEEGLYATLDQLDKRDCWYSGTNRTPEEQEDVLIVEVNGIKLAMLAYTFDMNGNEYEKKHLINEVRFNDETCDISLIQRHIKKAREKGADLIVATCHWGWEFEMYPHKNVVEVAHKLIDEGIDVILGGHPHVTQPMEKYKDGLILYSLGDFVSYHPKTRNSKITTVVRMNISKGKVDGKERTVVHGLQVMPVYILCAKKEDGTFDCRLLKYRTVLDDKPVNGKYTWGLTEQERQDLPRLTEKVLYGILLPKDYKDILVEK